VNTSSSPIGTSAVTGLLAGLAGTAAMTAMRMFDQQYAPATIPKQFGDPGDAIVEHVELITGGPPSKPIEQAAVLSMRLAYGGLGGMLYGLLAGRRGRSALVGGSLLGAAIYTAGYLGWLPLFGFTRPVWRQTYPQVAGEVLRHTAYGVATAAVYRMVNAAL
jgi:hypothetical protein